MRLLKILVLLIALALASCAEREGTNANAAARVTPSLKHCVNLNSATAEELIGLPGVGEVMSRKIIEYRERNGPFRRPEEIIIIEGFSEKKYRAIADLVCVE
nr:competence protein [uncultured bacterium]